MRLDRELAALNGYASVSEDVIEAWLSGLVVIQLYGSPCRHQVVS